MFETYKLLGQVSASPLPVPIVEQGLRQMAVLKLTDKDLPGAARFQDGVSRFYSFPTYLVPRKM